MHLAVSLHLAVSMHLAVFSASSGSCLPGQHAFPSWMQTCQTVPTAIRVPVVDANMPNCSKGYQGSCGCCKHAKLFQGLSGFLWLLQTCQALKCCQRSCGWCKRATAPKTIRVLVVDANMPNCSKNHQGSCGWCKHAKLFQKPSGFLWLM